MTPGFVIFVCTDPLSRRKITLHPNRKEEEGMYRRRWWHSQSDQNINYNNYKKKLFKK